MTEFESLKAFYASYIQFGLENNVNYNYAKLGNDIFHKYCERLVDNSYYLTKAAMKQELMLLKEALSKEIEAHYSK